MQKSSLVDVCLVSKYASGFRDSHRYSAEKAVLKKNFRNIYRKTPMLEPFFSQSCRPFSCIRTEYEYLSVSVSLCIQSECGKRPATLSKRASNTSFFLWILLNSQEHLFWRTSANRCSCGLLDALHHKQFVFHSQKWKHCIDERWMANFAGFTLICKHCLHKEKWENQKRNKRRKL